MNGNQIGIKSYYYPISFRILPLLWLFKTTICIKGTFSRHFLAHYSQCKWLCHTLLSLYYNKQKYLWKSMSADIFELSTSLLYHGWVFLDKRNETWFLFQFIDCQNAEERVGVIILKDTMLIFFSLQKPWYIRLSKQVYCISF
jgi:hypothetical protein